MSKAKKWQVLQLRLDASGKIKSQTTVGIPCAKKKADEILAYQSTKERRAGVVYRIVAASGRAN